MDAALIERLAKQSGLYISAELRIFAALIEAQMKERCAKVAESTPTCLLPSGSFLSERVAAAIRAL